MAAITYPKNLIFGKGNPLPLSGFPEGRARIRIRQDEFPVVYIKTADSIRKFYVKEEDGKWMPAFEAQANYRP